MSNVVRAVVYSRDSHNKRLFWNLSSTMISVCLCVFPLPFLRSHAHVFTGTLGTLLRTYSITFIIWNNIRMLISEILGFFFVSFYFCCIVVASGIQHNCMLKLSWSCDTFAKQRHRARNRARESVRGNIWINFEFIRYEKLISLLHCCALGCFFYLNIQPRNDDENLKL